jgi:hypothetical protein
VRCESPKLEVIGNFRDTWSNVGRRDARKTVTHFIEMDGVCPERHPCVLRRPLEAKGT